jgi:DNA-binding MarR family transcriptional regulator
MTHPTRRLDPAIHQPARLGILTAACETEGIDFVFVRDVLDLTDGNLSRHLTTLEKAGYIKAEKTFEGKKPRTWITATPAGRRALAEEIAALREIVGSVDWQPARGSRRTRPATQDEDSDRAG